MSGELFQQEEYEGSRKGYLTSVMSPVRTVCREDSRWIYTRCIYNENWETGKGRGIEINATVIVMVYHRSCGKASNETAYAYDAHTYN